MGKAYANRKPSWFLWDMEYDGKPIMPYIGDVQPYAKLGPFNKPKKKEKE